MAKLARRWRGLVGRHVASRKVQVLSSGRNSGTPIAIGVPVRNEAARLPRLLAAFDKQITDHPFTLCLFFDSCEDGSEQLVDSLSPRLRYPVVTRSSHSGGSPNAGAARQRAMAAALQIAGDGVLLTTDADSEPAPDWIMANLAALGQADVVAGRIVRDGRHACDVHSRLADYFDRLHAVRRAIDVVSWEAAYSHHWTSGASLACRSQVYRDLGGFPAIASGEDAAFTDRAARAGYRVRRDASVTVWTSSRRKGRVIDGFAAVLAAFDDPAAMPEVTHPHDEAWRFRMQAEARASFDNGGWRALASSLDLPLAEVEQVAGECANSEAFAARIVGAPPGGMRKVSLAHAEALLAGLDAMAMAGAA